MLDKRRKIWFIVIGAIVVISVIATLISNRKDRNNKQGNNSTSQVNTTVNNNTTNQAVNVVNNITVGNSSYKNEQVKPNVANLNDEVKQKVETYLNNYYKEVWKDLGEEYSEDDLTQMLNQGDNTIQGDSGFKQSFEQVYINNKVVSYSYYMAGNFRGTSREKVYGITFDVNTGEPVKIADIVTSKQNYIEACKKYVYEKIKNDKRYSSINGGYENVVNTHIENLEGYLTEDGIVCVIIQKYEIAPGAAGTFEYTIPYDKVKDYIKSEYVF